MQQIQEQATSVLAPFEWMGVDLLASIQLLAFLVFGYLFTQTWTWSRKRTSQALLKNKKLQDDDDEQTASKPTCPEVTSPATPTASQTLKKKARHANAQERKRGRKGKEVDSKSSLEESLVKPVQMEAPPEDLKNSSKESPVEPVLMEPAPEVTSAMDEVDTFMNWHVVETKAEKRMAKQREQAQPPAAQIEEVQEQHELRKTQPEAAMQVLEDAEQEVVMQKQISEDSSPSTQSHPETDGSSEPLIIGSQSTSSNPEGLQDGDAHGLCEISTPDLTPRNMYNSSMQGCGFNAGGDLQDCGFNAGGDFQEGVGCEVQPEPHMEAWVPVAIPMEYFQGDAMNPASIFDGFWQNMQNERILIEGVELKFENGPVWIMKEQLFNGFVVQIGVDNYFAELASDGQQLLWSDGDIWTCIGRLQQERPPLLIHDPSQLEGILNAAEVYMPAPPEVACSDDVPTFTPEARAEDHAEDDWEVCWDWMKGWCRRGSACEWKHPARRDRQEDTPFFEELKQMKPSMTCQECTGA